MHVIAMIVVNRGWNTHAVGSDSCESILRPA